ncbi:MAG: hypothetical protein LBD38_00155, partial [Streptococcaceae bacterium]|nr:hypothetical protein [Streptococcaceae bacterium]
MKKKSHAIAFIVFILVFLNAYPQVSEKNVLSMPATTFRDWQTFEEQVSLIENTESAGLPETFIKKSEGKVPKPQNNWKSSNGQAEAKKALSKETEASVPPEKVTLKYDLEFKTIKGGKINKSQYGEWMKDYIIAHNPGVGENFVALPLQAKIKINQKSYRLVERK